MPADFAVMEAQHRAVIEALTAAMAEPRSEFKRRWEDQQLPAARHCDEGPAHDEQVLRGQ